MKRKTTAILIFIAINLLAGCAQTTGIAVGTSRKPTWTENTVFTSAESLTQTVTPPPTFTPTSGPPPDLELKDVAIYPTTFMEASQDYYLMGRVKNNTKKIMVLSEDDLIFSFTFDVWYYNSDIYAKDYEHVRYKDDVKLGSDRWRQMNCILYPGDEGVFYYMTYSGRYKDYIVYETMPDYSGPLGIWYTYQSYYHTDPELPLHYHPGMENLQYSKENGVITFDYDVVNIPNLLDISNYSELNSWLILLDKEGNIINILKKLLGEMPGLKYGGSFHVHSSTAATPGAYDYFRPFMEITPEMIEQTDHLEVFNEFEESNICIKQRSE
jgi:hypothetical protein